ncbi:hypothetical protein [Paenibacillus sp. AD87]|uniref:hypothetical protein n=1 Tax=Paenibacillus sp. AD87 TaxID=1528787 RepID=UPI0007FDC7E9|nr:hypothetical protein [Paenibacillus sp. AD87]OAX45026.1 hypothetical protein gpAD87_29195 [Paenibacillus sp. AD87]
MFVRASIENFFIIMSVFFDSLLLRFNQQRNLQHVIRFCVHFLFNAIISSVLGVTGSFLGLCVLSLFIKTEYLFTGITLLTPSIFLFVCFTGVVLLNFRNESFSLPGVLYVMYVSIVISRPRRELIRGAIYFLTICISLCIILFIAIAYIFAKGGYELTNHSINKLSIYSISASFIITSFLFSYGTANELIRTYRQFVLWLMILGGVTVFSAYQINLTLSTASTPNAVTVASIVFGLILTMPTVADKGFRLFELFSQYFAEPIMEHWNECFRRYSIDSLLNALHRKKREFLLELSIIILDWRIGGRWHYIRAICGGIISSLFMWWYLQNIHNSNQFFKTYIDLLWRGLVDFVNGDKKVAEDLIAIGLTFLLLIYTFVSLIRTYSQSTWKRRYYSAGAVIIFFTVFLVLLSSHTPILENVIMKWVVLFLLPSWILIGSIVENVFRIYRWMRN